MREKIRKNKIFSILSMGAYLVSAAIFFCSAFLEKRILSDGELLGTACGGLFIAGTVLQGIQLLCEGPKVLDCFYIQEPRITKEEAEELKEWLREHEEQKEKGSPPDGQMGK